MEQDKKILHGTYSGAEGRASAFDLTLSGKIDAPLVVFAHGYKGFKDWGPWHKVAEVFAGKGFDFLKFNFSHNGGTVENPTDFPDTEAFARNTYSKEAEDFNTVLFNARQGLTFHTGVRKYTRIFLIGHSRGGGMAAITAAARPDTSGLALWASVADFGERFRFDLEQWEAEGRVYIKNARTGQDLPHDFTFYTDFRDHRERLDILAAARRIQCPALVVHGTDDEAVGHRNADRLHAALPESELLKIEGTGHTFGGKHPYTEEELPEPLSQAAAATATFFARQL